VCCWHAYTAACVCCWHAYTAACVCCWHAYMAACVCCCDAYTAACVCCWHAYIGSVRVLLRRLQAMLLRVAARTLCRRRAGALSATDPKNSLLLRRTEALRRCGAGARKSPRSYIYIVYIYIVYTFYIYIVYILFISISNCIDCKEPGAPLRGAEGHKGLPT
jgi:hypothetical protein